MGSTMAEIVKVQIPLNGPGPALVYEEGPRGRACFIEQLPPAATEAMGMAPKAFFEADWDRDQWVLRHRVDDQDW